jgi:hypothetical protein
MSIFKDWLDVTPMFCYLCLRIEQNEAVTLPMQVKDGFFTNLIRIKNPRSRKIINGRKAVHKSACARNERIEVCRQDTVDIATFYQLRESEVSPIDLGLVDVAPDQVAPDTTLQRCHTVGIIVGRRPRVGCWEMVLDVANNLSG